jgi:creatinine amidohydrolase
MRVEDMNWMDVEVYLRHDDRVMLVTGATEQHGYLSLLTDVRVPLALADAAAQQSGVLVAPPLNFGVSPYFLAYPGTISLRISTFLAVVEDMVRSLYGYGFRRFLILNGHGGNNPAGNHFVTLANELPGLRGSFYSWWLSHSVEQLAIQHQLKPTHASWLEAFPFTRVAEMPPEPKPPIATLGLVNAIQARQVYGDGNFGGPYQVDDAIMQQLFEVCLADVLYELRFGE